MNKLQALEDKISSAIERVKSLKEENHMLTQRLREADVIISQKDEEISRLASERDSIKNQVEELLGELESLEI